MMGVIYKILAKAIALRIGHFLCHTIHSCQSVSIGGRSINDNIVDVHVLNMLNCSSSVGLC